MSLHLPERALADLLADILAAAGASAGHARTVADNLARAEVLGHGSHGARLVNVYVDRLRAGAVDGAAEPVILRADGPILRIDGRRTFGQVVGAFSAEAGIAAAKRHGIAAVMVENSGHLGRNGAWPEMAAEAGIASLHFANSSNALAVVPFGGIEPLLGTNPAAFGIPAPDGRHVILDFASSELSMNTVKRLAETGGLLPAGSAVRRDGTPTQAPADVIDGLAALTAFGGFKGYGLAVLVEIFAGVIAGGEAQGTEAVPVNNMFSIYADIARLTDGERYGARLEAFLERLRTGTPRPGAGAIPVPGDRARGFRERHDAHGIPIDPALRGILLGAAERAGVSAAARAGWGM
ncbi:Ldh family oxidoreductase [Ancylobacter terrae]|uniref:Ldh family oxidoreductase n=1 Tax=Ancylobacter sp. sgz301288 TaxID=3342077 RepID=UPI00385DB91A